MRTVPVVPVVRYGRHLSEVSYFKCDDKDAIAKMFNKLRENKKVKGVLV